MRKDLALKIKENIKKDAKIVGNTIFDISKGIVRGVYSPFAVYSGFGKTLKEYFEDKSDTGSVRELIVLGAQAITGFTTQCPLWIFATEHNLKLELGGLMFVSNVADYIINLYKRSKNPEEYSEL